MSHRPGAHDLIDSALDGGSFQSWDAPVSLDLYPPDYAAELRGARQKAGTDEAVVTGRGSVDGIDVAVIVSEFRFLGGSIGAATAQRIVAAVRRATAERLPVIAAPASGGTRMQEGTPAFVQMVAITAAVEDHKAAGLPYLVYLRHPTTGGVFASWGSLGHVTVAEPGALIGFLGPKVYEALNGEPFPAGVQVAENLVDKGIIDAVVPSDQLAPLAGRVLRLLSPTPRRSAAPAGWTTAEPSEFATPASKRVWDSVLHTRQPDRPGVRELLRYAADDVIPLSGTGEGEYDAGLMLALTSFQGIRCVLIGQDRRNQARKSMGPAALREARRGMRLAEELGLPLVSVIDTPGADLSTAAEEGALAGEIARCIATISRMRTRTVSVILGQGCGGGALALLPADRVIAAENAWLSPLPPEGASVIMHGHPDHADAMAQRQHIGARQLLDDGIVHVVVPERPAAHLDPITFCKAIAAECARQVEVDHEAAGRGKVKGHSEGTGGRVGRRAIERRATMTRGR